MSDASMLNCYHNTAGELDWMDIEAVCDPMLQLTAINDQGPTFDFDDDGKNAADDDEKRIEPEPETVESQQSRTSHEGAEQSRAERSQRQEVRKEKKNKISGSLR